MQSRRACDRCYTVRAQCVPDVTTRVCARCARLDHACETKRGILRPGRPRLQVNSPQRSKVPRQKSTSPYNDLEQTQITLWGQHSPKLEGFSTYEISLVEFAIHPDQVSSLIYGRSFQDRLRSVLLNRLLFATDQMKDGFLAVAAALLDKKQAKICESGELSHTLRGSRAVSILGALRQTSLEDARTALVLALVLLTYNDLMVGLPALPISRPALLQAMPWRTQLIRTTTQETDPNIICVLFNEVFECLVLGQLPVFYYEPPIGNSIVDRYYGICHELLPHLYHICLLYRSLRTQELDSSERNERVERLAASIDQWLPDYVMSQRRNLVPDEEEEHHFVLQATCFKLAVQLLLCQAIRSLTNDMLASSNAEAIQREVSQAVQRGAGRPKYLLFPYFISCLELQDRSEEIPNAVLENMNEISGGMAPKSCESMFICLEHIRRNRERRPDLPWFECVDKDLHLAMGP